MLMSSSVVLDLREDVAAPEDVDGCMRDLDPPTVVSVKALDFSLYIHAARYVGKIH